MAKPLRFTLASLSYFNQIEMNNELYQYNTTMWTYLWQDYLSRHEAIRGIK